MKGQEQKVNSSMKRNSHVLVNDNILNKSRCIWAPLGQGHEQNSFACSLYKELVISQYMKFQYK
jgi:hypothetical protein